MQQREEVVLARDTEVIQVPEGTRATLPAGSRVWITQALGGTYTIMTPYGLLARVEAKDADALGKETEVPPASVEAAGSLEQVVWEQLKKCYDPEIPVNIVDLGLIYDCQLETAPEGKSKVAIKMTLTAPGCGMGEVLVQDVRRRVEEIPEVSEADIDLVFDPQWSMEMMTEAARLQLGLF